MTKPYTYEDLAPGVRIELGQKTVDAAEIIAFASEFDPQPMHLDEDAGKHSILGGLSASGWHTASMFMRLFCDGLLLNSTGQGSPGLDYLRWKKPVLAGDTLLASVTCVDARLLKSRPGVGVVTLEGVVVNQRDEVVMELRNAVMFRTREVLDRRASIRTHEGRSRFLIEHRDKPKTGNHFSVRCSGMSIEAFLRMGERVEIGRHLFSADEIIRYAEKFDPQPFHLDREAAEQSVLGGLCASGWHTASSWMRYNVAFFSKAAADWKEGPVPQFGPSPGMKNLKWVKPVYGGSTITFHLTNREMRPLASRPGWSMLTGEAGAQNEAGEPVLVFESAVLVKLP